MLLLEVYVVTTANVCLFFLFGETVKGISTSGKPVLCKCYIRRMGWVEKRSVVGKRPVGRVGLHRDRLWQEGFVTQCRLDMRHSLDMI